MNKKGIVKYLIGFGMFMLYFSVARQLENRVALVKKLTGAA